MVLAHLVVIIIRCIILGLVYSAIIVLVASPFYPNAGARRKGLITEKLTFLFFKTFAVIFIGLFIFSRTHYGYDGTGETASFPVNSDVALEINEVDQISCEYEDGTATELEWLDAFSIDDERLYGQINDTTFVIYDFSMKEKIVINGRDKYEAFASRNDYPKSSDFREFSYYYQRYWRGWRRWLLP
jgi:hypothetical protein